MASFNTKAQDGGSLSLGGEQLKGSLKTSSQQNATAVDATNITSESGPTHKYTITSNKTSMFIYMGFPSNSKLILLGKLNAIPGSADFDFKITLINNTANRSEDSGMKVIASYDENDETLRIIILGKQFKATTGYLKIMILTYAGICFLGFLLIHCFFLYLNLYFTYKVFSYVVLKLNEHIKFLHCLIHS